MQQTLNHRKLLKINVDHKIDANRVSQVVAKIEAFNINFIDRLAKATLTILEKQIEWVWQIRCTLLNFKFNFKFNNIKYSTYNTNIIIDQHKIISKTISTTTI